MDENLSNGMTVSELINELSAMPLDDTVYIEGSAEFRVLLEKCPDNHHIVRIFKPWDVDFVLDSAGLSEDEL